MEDRPSTTFRHTILVAWGDCDPAKIVYTARLPWFTLDSINAWWHHHLGGGWYHMVLDLNIGAPFVRLEMDFKAPVTPRHSLECHVWPVALGKTSISFRVDGEQDGKTCFAARTVSVFVIADQFKKQEPPTDIRQVVEAEIQQTLLSSSE